MMIVLAMTGIAHADDAPKKKSAPPLEPYGFFSLPYLFGVDTAIAGSDVGTGFLLGVRPEYIRAWTREDTSLGFGFGPYVEFQGSTGTSQVWLGGGASLVGYFGSFGVALSGGLDVDWLHAVPEASPVVGMFIGFRTAWSGTGCDFPFGLRIDYHPPLGPLPSVILVSAQLDLAVAFTVGFLGAMMKGLSN